MWRNRWNRANCKKWVYLATAIVAAPPLSSCSTKELNGSLFQLADKLERPSTAARIETNVTRQVCSQVSSLFAVVWSAAYRIAHSGALCVCAISLQTCFPAHSEGVYKSPRTEFLQPPGHGFYLLRRNMISSTWTINRLSWVERRAMRY
jgi:hypothetical protein